MAIRRARLGARSRDLVLVHALASALALTACGAPSPTPVAPPPAASAALTTPLPPPREDGHLPALATPLKYTLALDVDPASAGFRGTARIELDVAEPTSWLVLHARGLRVTRAQVLAQGGVFPARTSERASIGGKSPEELVVALDRAVPRGRATLEIAWEGPWDEELSGLYRVKDGDRWYAFTQFEATDARRAFPCFDEPGYKVPFDVSITTPNGLLAVANTKEASRETNGGKTTFHFKETLPLPTYLLAFAVGDFDVRELERPPAGTSSLPPIRLVTTKGKSNLGALALETTAGLTNALANWIGIPYPYEKLDIVAVPEFSAGAMENAGLITFREEILLLDPARASVRARRNQAMVVAHELAHQWFGNLVTASWWNDLWLNEGFATWMEWRIVDKWRPQYQVRFDAVVSTHGVMDLDALASARAVRQPVVSTSDAHEAFDGITYEKGAAILATIERWIGEDAFRRGVRDYLRDNAHKSVQADRLLSSLDKASGKDVSSMAASFLDHAGIPEVSVEVACEPGSRWHAELVQEPWRPLGSKAENDGGQSWTIPVCVLAQGEKKSACADMLAGAPSLVAGRGCPTFVHPNADASYYRFSLPESGFTKLASARTQLDVPGRISLLSNAWAQVRAGRLKAEAMLKLLPSFDADPSRQVIEEVGGILGAMSETLVADEGRAAFRKYVAARFAKRKKELGWLPKKEEAAGSGDETMLRHAVLRAMGDLAEDESTLREADDLARRWLADPTSVDEDTAAIAVDLASRHAGPARLAELVQAAANSKTREDRHVALRAMMGFDDAAVLTSALDTTLGEAVRANEMRYAFGAAFARRKSRPVAEAWIRAHWDELRKKLPGSLGGSLVRAASIACTKSEIDERKAFYTPRAATIEGAERPLAESLESASLCAELRAHSAAGLTRALLNAK
ncbi:Membrane alanine aminopeptidase N [Labilithrix luteola]|uniref:Aminopeptidase n=1 Tax=Labilithrix luteola TaxID=1391654 RepID=A0A0K1QBI7_9BACT|nr:M1 family metallopeptidase [Labilithrix luteola]AKV03151.1 Membrane alanine aminopeptidase N [Labilithrix luteola]